MRGLRRVGALAVGGLAALLPVLAQAQEGSRALEPTADWTQAMLATAGAIVALLLVATLGLLYRERRNLHWDFQNPEQPHDEHH